MEQQEFWNKKFLREGYLYGKEANRFLVSCEKNFKKDDRLLCLGEGEGRNAVYFAKKGFKVAAIDASDVGLKKLEEFAKNEEVKVKTKCLDLNSWEPTKKYGTIVASYLHMYKNDREKLFEKVENALKSGGFFAAEFFSQNQLNYESGGPKDLELLYTIEDFKNQFKDSKILKLEESITILDEGKGHQGEASVIRLIIQKN